MRGCHGSGVDDGGAVRTKTKNKIEQRGAKQGRTREKHYVKGTRRMNGRRGATTEPTNQ